MTYVVRNSLSVTAQAVDRSSGITGRDATRKMARHVADLKYEMLPVPPWNFG